MEQTAQDEKLITTDVTLNTDDIDAVANHVVTSLHAASHVEIIAAVVLPILAIIIGQTINRWIDRKPKESISANIIDFMGSLLSPGLAVLFLMGAGFTMRFMEIELFVLPFVWKVAVAWFAIRFVTLMSTRQSAGWVIILVIIPITLLHLFGVWQPVTEALEGIKFTIGKVKLNVFLIIQSVGAIIGLFWVAGFIVRATDRRLRRVRNLHISNRVLIMKILQIVIYFIAFLLGLQFMGISLTVLGVLGGALGVGIGFGLQKIASNFISGIILLFEKSVSVDDLIQLEDGTTGFIRQNAARYTLLELSDGREMLIPNEEFITQRVTTLTHSSRRGRVEIPVGVGYDSNVDLVQKLLVEAAQSCPRCIDDPAPAAFLRGFGDSALNFSLFFWVEDVVEGRLAPTHEVMSAILKLFAKNNIEIPYPHQVQVEKEAKASTDKSSATRKAKKTDT